MCLCACVYCLAMNSSARRDCNCVGMCVQVMCVCVDVWVCAVVCFAAIAFALLMPYAVLLLHHELERAPIKCKWRRTQSNCIIACVSVCACVASFTHS